MSFDGGFGGGGGDAGGGGGDAGGGGKGSSGDKGGGGGGSGYSGGPAYTLGGDTADYGSGPVTGGSGGSPLALTDPGTSSGSLSDFVTNPTGSSLDVVNDPSQGNLTGPGPVTGSPASGGGSSPFAFDNSSFLAAADSMTQPVSSGGVFDSGTTPVAGLSSTAVPGQPAFQSIIDSTAAAPGGPSASAIAPPASVASSPDAASSTDFSSVNKNTTASSGTGSGGSSAGDITKSLGISNPLGAAVAGAGLLKTAVAGQQTPPYSPQLNQNAAFATDTAKQQTSAGQALQQWQTTGTLPDSYESQIQKAAQDAKTRAISNAAAQGLPTDPKLNTALAQQLNAIDAAIPGQREQIATQLAQSGQQMINAGLQATGISSGVFQTLANLQNQKDQATGNAIANFASALNGGNKGVTLKVA